MRWFGLGRKADTGTLAVPEKYAALHQQLLQMFAAPAQQTYITGRWLEAVVGARRGMKRDQRWFRRANAIALGASAVTPVLVTATAATTDALRSVLTVLAVCFSLVAAAGGVLVQTLRPGIRWRLHRTLRDQLEALAWDQFAAVTAGRSSAHSDGGWTSFVQETEKAIGEHNATYAEEVAGVIEPSSGTSS